jgi:energy-coupling factor transport system substrate-specific component
VPRGILLGAAVVTFAGGALAALSPEDAGLSLLLVAVALIAFGFAWLESGPGSAKEVALVAVLGGVAGAGRVLFTAVPGVQPVTVVAVAAGAALGARVGFGVGAVAALVSNFYLGQGIWTPWQMLAWGSCGVVGALAARLIRRRWAFAALCFALGFAFSSAMDLWHWYTFWPHTWQALTAVYGRGVWFSAAHAIGNVAFALAIGPELRRLLERYGKRLRTEVVWAPSSPPWPSPRSSRRRRPTT